MGNVRIGKRPSRLPNQDGSKSNEGLAFTADNNIILPAPSRSRPSCRGTTGSLNEKAHPLGVAERWAFSTKFCGESDYRRNRVRLPPQVSQTSLCSDNAAKSLILWRPRRESNPRTRICSPLRSHSATRPPGRSADDCSAISAERPPPQASKTLSPPVVKSSLLGFSIRFGAAICALPRGVIPDSSVGRASDC